MNAPFSLSFMRFRLLLLVSFLFSSVVGNQFVGQAQSTCATRTSFTGWEKYSIVQYCYDSNITGRVRCGRCNTLISRPCSICRNNRKASQPYVKVTNHFREGSL